MTSTHDMKMEVRNGLTPISSNIGHETKAIPRQTLVFCHCIAS